MCQISDIITKITGLTNRDLDDQQTFSYHYPKLCEFFLGADTVIAHNLTFDLSLLKFELQRMGKQWAFPYPYKHICTVEKTMSIKGYRLNLGKLHKHLTGEDHLNGAHRAMADVEALTRCAKKLREQGVI
jgi:DNA polymerase III epsilon subunit-like protein